MINPKWPWLGASPDGLIAQNGELLGGIEIKCPYSKRHMLVSESCEDKNFFMVNTELGPTLKKSHYYYYQCQGVMNIVGLQWMDFVVYTEKDLYVERINCDSSLWKSVILPKLAEFYKNYVLTL